MIIKRFYLYCIIRVLVISGSACLAAFLFFQTRYFATAIFICLLLVYQVYALIRFVTKTNRELSRLFDSVRYGEFSQSFSDKLRGSGFEELSTAFKNVIDQFQTARLEKEEQFQFLRTIVDHVGIALIAFDERGEVALINNAAKRLFRVPRLQNIKDIAPVNSNLAARLLDMSPGGNDLIKLKQNDDLMQLSMYATGFMMRQQALKLVAIQNIQNELEEKEMISWQNLIRVLTHEIMNSITPIASLSSTANDLLKDESKCEIPETINETIDDVRHAVRTIEKRSKGLLTFIENYRQLTRIPKPDYKIVLIKDLVDRVEHLMQDQFLHKAIEFNVDIDPETLEVTADQALIEQVLINLCKNAVEAVADIGAPRIRINADTDSFGNPVISVIDNGKGITEEVAEKVFIPFFTTKPEGSGIGLSLSRQIMRHHKGTLTVQSEPGVETVFSLRF